MGSHNAFVSRQLQSWHACASAAAFVQSNAPSRCAQHKSQPPLHSFLTFLFVSLVACDITCAVYGSCSAAWLRLSAPSPCPAALSLVSLQHRPRAARHLLRNSAASFSAGRMWARARCSTAWWGAGSRWCITFQVHRHPQQPKQQNGSQTAPRHLTPSIPIHPPLIACTLTLRQA